jgi:hypothetical protein
MEAGLKDLRAPINAGYEEFKVKMEVDLEMMEVNKENTGLTKK